VILVQDVAVSPYKLLAAIVVRLPSLPDARALHADGGEAVQFEEYCHHVNIEAALQPAEEKIGASGPEDRLL
jgi:hypothetical protein